MYLLIKRINQFFIITAFTLVNVIPASSQSLSEMVDQVLSNHEDIINSKKELEEASRDVTDAQLVLRLIYQ